MNTYTKLKHPLALIFFLALGFGVGSATSNALAKKKVDYLINAIEAERTMSLGSLYEIMAWEAYHLTQNGLEPKNMHVDSLTDLTLHTHLIHQPKKIWLKWTVTQRN